MLSEDSSRVNKKKFIHVRNKKQQQFEAATQKPGETGSIVGNKRSVNTLLGSQRLRGSCRRRLQPSLWRTPDPAAPVPDAPERSAERNRVGSLLSTEGPIRSVTELNPA